VFNHIIRLEVKDHVTSAPVIDKFIHFERKKARVKPVIDSFLMQQDDSLSLILPLLKSAKDQF
jgi:hypothetical protein